jgi:IS4 transposase
MRKTKEAEAQGLKKLRETNARKGRGEPSKAQKAYNRYVIIITSIEGTEASVLMELYRQRWQIELAFKRLKSLFGYNEIPVNKDQSAQAWFYGKLLLAAVCETWVNKGRFSPSGHSVGSSQTS